MPKVILQISYEIQDAKREDYLQLVKDLKRHFIEEQKKEYAIFEQRGKKNCFVEQFTCSSMDEYEALEDNMNENSESLVNKLETMLKPGTSKYLTLIEI
ncbi:MAG TPA: hypothetical protein PK595_00610 [Bacteroidota bacterium]|jgi:hypothetical protein|nr:hypothetical protein [Bacteroidota bacterium]